MSDKKSRCWVCGCLNLCYYVQKTKSNMCKSCIKSSKHEEMIEGFRSIVVSLKNLDDTMKQILEAINLNK